MLHMYVTILNVLVLTHMSPICMHSGISILLCFVLVKQSKVSMGTPCGFFFKKLPPGPEKLSLEVGTPLG